MKDFLLVLCCHYPFRVWLVEGLVVMEWNHEIGGGVGVVSVIDQYLGWECFGTAG